MKQATILFSIFAVLLGALAAAHAATTVHLPHGLTCTDQRVSTFGWTDKRVALAELAAILKWQKQTEKTSPGFGNWHLSNKRSIKCQMFRNSAHFQCQVSARPCRFERS